MKTTARRGFGALKIKDIEMKRQEALSKQDAVQYYDFCVEAGLSLDRIEDKGLYERGCMEFSQIEAADAALDPGNPFNTAIDDAVAEEFAREGERNPLVFSDSDRTYWANLASIVLPRFPESEKGNGIKTREIKNRLVRAHREASRTDLEVSERLEVADVSGWERDRMWNYLVNSIKPAVERAAGLYCPETLKGIYAKNAWQKRVAMSFR